MPPVVSRTRRFMDYTPYFSWALALALVAIAGVKPSTVITDTLKPIPVIPSSRTDSDSINPSAASNSETIGRHVEHSVTLSQPIPITPKDNIWIRLMAPNRGYFTLPYKVELLDGKQAPLQLDGGNEWIVSNFSGTRTLNLPVNVTETTSIYVRLSHLGTKSALPIRLKVERSSILSDYLSAGILGCLGIGGLAFLATTKSGRILAESFEQQVNQSPVTEILGDKDTLIRVSLRATLMGKMPYQMTLNLRVLDEQGQRLWSGEQVVMPKRYMRSQGVATGVWFLILPQRQNYRLFGQIQGSRPVDSLLLSVVAGGQTNRPVDVITIDV